MNRILHSCRWLAALALVLGTLQAQTLEIHQMTVGQGDACLIVVRDTAALRDSLIAHGDPIPVLRHQMLVTAIDSNTPIHGTALYAILIDAGQNTALGSTINDYLEAYGIDTLNEVMLSHYHKDHIGSFKAVITKSGIPILRAWDRGDENKKPPTLAPASRDNWLQPLRDSAITRRPARADSTFIRLKAGDSTEIRMTCVASNGKVLRQARLPRLSNDDENNYSVCWILQYGAFRWYSGGDLNGFPDSKKIDLETPLMDSLRKHDHAAFRKFGTATALNAGHVCAFKVGHHGGEESTNNYLVATLSPKVAIISSGNGTYNHPRFATTQQLDSLATDSIPLDTYKVTRPALPRRIANPVQNYFITSVMSKGTNGMSGADWAEFKKIGTPATRGIIGGNIITVVDDRNIWRESKFMVYWDGAASPTSGKFLPVNASDHKYYRCHSAARRADVRYILNR